MSPESHQSESDPQAVYDAMGDLEAEVCEYAGHDWADAGGGLLICTTCTAEKWEDERG